MSCEEELSGLRGGVVGRICINSNISSDGGRWQWLIVVVVGELEQREDRAEHVQATTQLRSSRITNNLDLSPTMIDLVSPPCSFNYYSPLLLSLMLLSHARLTLLSHSFIVVRCLDLLAFVESVSVRTPGSLRFAKRLFDGRSPARRVT